MKLTSAGDQWARLQAYVAEHRRPAWALGRVSDDYIDDLERRAEVKLIVMTPRHAETFMRKTSEPLIEALQKRSHTFGADGSRELELRGREFFQVTQLAARRNWEHVGHAQACALVEAEKSSPVY